MFLHRKPQKSSPTSVTQLCAEHFLSLQALRERGPLPFKDPKSWELFDFRPHVWPEFSNHMFHKSLRPAKPTRKQGGAAGQERHIAGGTSSAQVLQIWGPLSWASDDRALMSLKLAPKAATAFGKKSQFYVLALILSLHPKLEQGQGPCCRLTGGRHLLPSPPALKSSAASSPSSWEGSVSPSR